MAKKQRRNVSKASSSLIETPQNSTTSSRLSSTEFNPDYTDIISDLKRIAVLAVSFFGILIALSFFLR